MSTRLPTRRAPPPGESPERPPPACRRAADITLIELILTAACNLKCSYCWQDARSGRRMNWEIVRAALDRLLRSRGRDLQITLYGGEPLLEMPLIRRAVGYVRRRRPPGKRIRWVLLTNGTRLAPEAAAFLFRHGVITQISADGVPAVQAARGKGTFRIIDRLLDRLRRDQPEFFRRKVSVSMTLTAAGVPHLARSVRYFLRKGVREIRVGPVITPDPAWTPELRLELAEQFRTVSQDCLRDFRRTGEVPFVPFRRTAAAEPGRPRGDGSARRPSDGRQPGEPTCRAGRGNKIAVGPGGQVTSCVLLAGDYQRFPSAWLRKRVALLALGDVRDPQLEQRLAGLPAAARATGLFHHPEETYSSYGRCGDCRWQPECAVCPVSAGHIPGNRDPRRVPDFVCAFNQEYLFARERFNAALRSFTGGGRRK